jgi:hypothetical protein
MGDVPDGPAPRILVGIVVAPQEEAGMDRRALGLLGAASACALLSACSGPQFQYAADKPGSVPAGTVYMKVPSGWSQVPTKQIQSAESGWGTDTTAKTLLDATAWQEAWDASPTPSIGNVLGSTTPTHPVVYASLRSLYQEESGVTPEALRDMVVPISTLGTQVDVLSEDKVTQGSATGVHLVFAFTPKPGLPEETIDQTAYLSDGKDAVYLLVVRCTTDCYRANAGAIHDVTSSYTIQEGRRG